MQHDEPVASLRDRLLRAVLHEDLRQRERVPWYAWDSEGGERSEAPDGQAFVELRQRKPGKGRVEVGGPGKVSRGTQTDSSGDESAPRDQVTVAIVHQPADVPVSTSGVTSVSSSAPITTTSAMPVFAQTVLGKPYAAGDGGIVSQASGPRLSMNANFVDQLPRGWEYYSAERIRQVRAPGPEAALERVQVITPPTRPGVSRVSKGERTWYTPRQEWDRIEHAPSTGEASAAESGPASGVFGPRTRRPDDRCKVCGARAVCERRNPRADEREGRTRPRSGI